MPLFSVFKMQLCVRDMTKIQNTLVCTINLPLIPAVVGKFGIEK